MRRGVKIGIGAGVVVVVGLAAVGFARRGRNQGVEVQAGVVGRKDIVSIVLANGKLQPRNKVDISANIAGQIVNLAVREGDRVTKGDFLLQIDRVQYQASTRSSEANLDALLHDRDAAKANLEQARYDFEKAERSLADKVIPQADFQRSRSVREAAEASYHAALGRVEQARASLEGARDSLSKTTIRAPLSGVITSLPVHEGEVAVIGTMNNPGTVLMTVSDLASMEADLAVDETDLPRLAVGQKAKLSIEAYPERSFEGVVREIGSSPIRPNSDAALRTGTISTEAIDFEVKVSIVAPPDGLRPGFSTTAEIETGRAQGVPAVPIQALVTRELPGSSGSGAGGQSGAGGESAAGPSPGPPRGPVQEGVYRVEKGVARFVPIHTGLTGPLEVEVKDGVAADDQIVIGPFRALRELKDGDRVRVKPGDEGKGGAGAPGGGERRTGG